MTLRQQGDSLSGEWLDDLLRRVWSKMPVHDPDCGIAWACGNCPYFNVGPVCTKCAAPREDGSIWHVWPVTTDWAGKHSLYSSVGRAA